jgi:hypothetical protein
LYIINVYIKIFKIMDVLNFISWIKNGQQVTTVDPTQTLLPLGLKDPRRDDGYRSGTITAQDFINSVTPPSIVSAGTGLNSTERTGLNNCAQGDISVVFGSCNFASDVWATISGGCCNQAIASRATIVGGNFNSASGSASFIGGGSSNNTSGGLASILGGQLNQAGASNSSIAGAGNSTVNGNHSFIGGGQLNTVTSACSSILGGRNNSVGSTFSLISGGCCNIACSSGCRTGILGGHFNRTINNDSFVVGSCIITDRACTTFVNNLSIMNIPTSSAGLPSKSVWSNAGVLTIVP